MSSAFGLIKKLARHGLPLAILLLVSCGESEAQIFRGRATRLPGTTNSQLSSSGWRPAQTNTRINNEPSLSLPAPDRTTTDSGLGDLVRPNSPDQLPVEGEIQPTHPAAGTPVPEHYYRGDWRRDPAYNPGYPNYPRYFGGFHSSHYYDLGIPNGDKGFRGNGIYWTPW